MLSNLPPDGVNPLRDRLAEQYGELRARAAELCAAVERVPASLDEASIIRATEFVRQLKGWSKKADEARKAEKEEFLQAGRTVDAFFKELTDRLADAAKTVEGRINVYLRAKEAEERKRREEEARRQAEEAARRVAEMASETDMAAALAAEEAAYQAAKAAQAKPADLARTRGDLGGVATLRKSWEFEITGRVDLETLRPHLPLTAIEQAIRSYIRAGGRELGGVRIFEDSKAMVR